MRDEAICALVSNTEQEMKFTEFKDPLLSSVDSHHIVVWNEGMKRPIKERKMMKSTALGTVLKKIEAPTRFELLTIDVEGHDFEVLTSIDLNVYRPKLIVIESHEWDLLKPASNRIYSYLQKHRYAFVGYAISNCYFLDCSNEAWATIE